MRYPPLPVRPFRVAAIAFAIAALASIPAAAEPRASHGRREGLDPLVPMLRRVDRFLESHESDGVVLDSRYDVDPTEVVRLTCICQLLGYAELEKVVPRRRFLIDIRQRADYLLARFDQVRSGTVFDGMLGYALVEAYVATGDPRYLDQAAVVIRELEAIPQSEYILNGGLMAAMAFARFHQVTGDPQAGDLAHLILAGVPPYQHADGSFPHWCPCSRDVSYTGWMCQELMMIERMLDDPVIDPMLTQADAFLRGRVLDNGDTSYEAPCPGVPDCTIYYWSYASGCTIDYDTRGFPNELSYTGMLFDRFQEPKYAAVMGFLDSLEDGGTWPDKWAYFPPPTDPYYVWTTADTSLMNISNIFWTLACTFSGRPDRAAAALAWAADEVATGQIEGDLAGLGRVSDPQPIVPVAARARRVVTDSLLAAGVDGALYCDAPQAPGGGARRDPGVGASRPDSPAPASGAGRAGRDALRLDPVAPNPARGECVIRYATAGGAPVTLAIFDAGGRRVREIAGGREAGEHALRWDGRDAAGRPCPSGSYLVRASAGGKARVTRLLLLR